MAEFLNGYNFLGEIVRKDERKKLMEYAREYSLRNGDAPFAIPAIHLMLINPKGELYITKRGDKDEDPHLYDKTVGGHIVAGKSDLYTLAHESSNEIGVRIVPTNMNIYPDIIRQSDLTKVAVVKQLDFNPWVKTIRQSNHGPWVKRWMLFTYIGMYDGEFTFHDGEAIDYKTISIDDLVKEMTLKPDEFTHDLHSMLRKYCCMFEPVMQNT